MKSYSMTYAGSSFNTVGGIEGGERYLTIEGSLVSCVVRSLLCSLCL